MNYVRLLLIGNSGVGKTNLMNRYFYNKFQGNVASTIGIDFATKSVKINESEYKVQCWDCSGQDKFKSIVKSYYRGADCILLVYDVASRRSFTDLVEFWLPEIEKMNPEAHLVLIGNKADLQGQVLRQVELEEGMELADLLKIPFFETSAAENTLVETAFKAAIDSVILTQFYNQRESKIHIDVSIVALDEQKTNYSSCCF